MASLRVRHRLPDATRCPYAYRALPVGEPWVVVWVTHGSDAANERPLVARDAPALVSVNPQALAASVHVTAVAVRVGYDNPFAFGAAFKRGIGLSPSAYRERVVAGTITDVAGTAIEATG